MMAAHTHAPARPPHALLAWLLVLLQGSYGPSSHPPSPGQPRSPVSGTSPTHSRAPTTMSSSPFVPAGSERAAAAARAMPFGSHNLLHTPPHAQAGGLAAWGLWSPHSSLAHASAAHAHHPLAHPPVRDYHLLASAPQPPFALSSLQLRSDRPATSGAAAVADRCALSAHASAERDTGPTSSGSGGGAAQPPPLHPSVAPFLPPFSTGVRKPLPGKQHSAPHSPSRPGRPAADPAAAPPSLLASLSSGAQLQHQQQLGGTGAAGGSQALGLLGRGSSHGSHAPRDPEPLRLRVGMRGGSGPLPSVASIRSGAVHEARHREEGGSGRIAS